MLHNHVEDIQSKLVCTTRRGQKLEKELAACDESSQQLEEAHQVIQKVLRRDKRLRRKLAKTASPDVSQLEAKIADQTRVIIELSDQVTQLQGASQSHGAGLSQQHKLVVKDLRQKLEQAGTRESKLQQELADSKSLFQSEKSHLQKVVAGIKRKVNEILKIQRSIVDAFRLLQQCYGSFRSQMEAISPDVRNLLMMVNPLKAENSDLSQKIGSIESAFQNLHQRMQTFRGHYKKTLTESESLRQSNLELQSSHDDHQIQIQSLQAELDSLRIASRSLEIQLRTQSEKSENEKRELSSQLLAKLTANQNEFEKVIASRDDRDRSQLLEILKLSSRYLNESEYSNPIPVVRTLVVELDRLTQLQPQYLQSVDDVMSAHELLGQSDSSLTRSIHKLMNELDDRKSTNMRLQEIERTLKSENAKLESQVKSLHGQIGDTNQWLRWARRVHGIVYNNDRSSALSIEELKTALEEAIFLSISHRSFIFKMSILKEEKKALLRFGESLAARSKSHPGLLGIMAIALGIRRMQQCAGCLPLSIAATFPG
jgi:chromosome segregation ATPase